VWTSVPVSLPPSSRAFRWWWGCRRRKPVVRGTRNFPSEKEGASEKKINNNNNNGRLPGNTNENATFSRVQNEGENASAADFFLVIFLSFLSCNLKIDEFDGTKIKNISASVTKITLKLLITTKIKYTYPYINK
jgi:hypothetical protein